MMLSDVWHLSDVCL